LVSIPPSSKRDKQRSEEGKKKSIKIPSPHHIPSPTAQHNITLVVVVDAKAKDKRLKANANANASTLARSPGTSSSPPHIIVVDCSPAWLLSHLAG